MHLIDFALLVLGSACAHMALTEPAPRRSPHHPGYPSDSKDYDMTSPLGDGRPFPCRGAPVGPVYKAYKAGSEINVHIDGSAKHMGGHCQFSVTYDQVNFAVLKTVLGDCIIAAVDYKVPLPRDAPSGNVTLAWTWFNKVGNREMYMNCVDIEITGGSAGGTIKGKKMVVANLPGYPTFPEGFDASYGKDMYEAQPLITIAPKASAKPIPTVKPTPTAPKPTQTIRPTPTVPKPTQNPAPQYCVQGTHICQNVATIGLCWNRTYSFRACPSGSRCVASAGDAMCK